MMKKHNPFARAMFATIAAGSFVFAAHAGAATEDEQAAACRGDAMHFCSAEIPNKDKITACMKQHLNELSPKCRAMFHTARPRKKS